VYSGGADTWTPVLVLDDPPRARYGCNIALDGDTLAIGGPAPTAEAITPFVDVFGRVSGAWALQQRVRPNVPAFSTNFGAALDLRGSRMAVGAPLASTGRGAAYLFERTNGVWSEERRFSASDGAVDDAFGASVGFTNDMLLVGAPERKNGTGAVYTYFLGLEGDACTTGDVCASGFCVDGVCCENACGGGDDTDCMACSAKNGAAKDGVCGPSKGECRKKRDACDVAETCDGTSLLCPADVAAVNGTSCAIGNAAGVCGGGRCIPFSNITTTDAGAPPGAAPSDDGGCALADRSSMRASLVVPSIAVFALLFALRRRRSSLTKP